MLKINYKNNWYEIEFNGIKILETTHTTNLIKQILANDSEETKLIIDNKNIKWKNVIYINEWTKYNDFLSLNKSNSLYKNVLDKIKDNSLINDELIESIINEINIEFNIDLLSKQYDLNKIIGACFEMNNLGYLVDKDLISILNKMDFDEKKLIIFDNVSYINYEKCKLLLNNFNILIFCSDIRGTIKTKDQLELCCFINKTIFDVVNVEKLISFIEMKSSLVINNITIQNYLDKKDDQTSSIINFYLKNF